MALYEAGYGSSRGLYARAPEQLGMTPGAYRRGGQGMVIHTIIVDSPLGRLLIGATERGVCSVCLGDEDAKLTAALRAEYPAARIEEDGLTMDEVVEAFLRYLPQQGAVYAEVTRWPDAPFWARRRGEAPKPGPPLRPSAETA